VRRREVYRQENKDARHGLRSKVVRRGHKGKGVDDTLERTSAGGSAESRDVEAVAGEQAVNQDE
jgi:hypothetical protein